ncbi:hypothetical protein SAMN05444266_101636 [Chitinophaga jiangningensis]|uniref:Uncharacterized protein n=1 Tax=Chitinophaga jiangningensis TaxID=1419482 RepID=A0A1M6WID4_9BACT|nr:hypothetical protein [Chitinophaga jiangningensis]SHK93399.1 hypothetical protein SAMN05444266_101636 [Chitinophaga jiangningensis]
MKQIPILFNTMMVYKLCANDKDQTRRTTGLEVVNQLPDRWVSLGMKPDNGILKQVFHDFGKYLPIECPFGQPGDILWVRETLQQVTAGILEYQDGSLVKAVPEGYCYQAGQRCKVPSIHMPKWAARIWLQVLDVRVERLHQISDQDAIGEGITVLNRFGLTLYQNYDGVRDFLEGNKYTFDFGKEIHSAAKASFCTLWMDVYGRDSWVTNPWVWVVKWQPLSVTGKPVNIPEQ